MKKQPPKKSFLLQHDQSDCGVACLASIIRFYGGEASLEKIRNLSGTSIHGTSLLGLYHAASQLGFDAEGLEAETIDQVANLMQPVVLHIEINDQLQHYFVFYSKNLNDQYIVGDPSRGVTVYSKSSLEKVWKTRTLLKLTPNERFQVLARTGNSKRRWLAELLVSDTKVLMIASILGVVISGLGLSTAIFFQALIDNILPTENTHKLWTGLFALLFLLASRTLLNYLRGLFLCSQAREFNNRIISKFYSRLLTLPKSFFDTRKMGDLVARLNDTRRIQMTISLIASNLVIDFLVVTTSLIAIIVYSFSIGLLVLIIIPTSILIAWHFNARISATQKDAMQCYASSESNYVDSIQGIDVIRALGKEELFSGINRNVYGSFQDKLFDLGRISIQYAAQLEILGVVITVGLFGLTSWMVLNKELKLGEMVALLGLAGAAIPSVAKLVVSNIQIQEAKIAFDRMFEYTHMNPATTDAAVPEASAIGAEKMTLKVENLCFRFPGQKLLLHKLSISVSRNEWIAILGPSGAGKSTFLQILQKFYLPESGSITLNDLDWSKINKTDWHKLIGVVPQEVKLFNGTLIYNIVLGSCSEEWEEAVNYCRKIGLEPIFAALPQGYHTLLGESGINISGGQKQLVALARALVRKPKLLLLDEVSAALDRVTEKFVIDLLQQLRSEMAILMITHKKSLAQLADRVYVLDKTHERETN